MASRDLTVDQCRALKAQLDRHCVYFRRLLKRIEAERFPANDPMRTHAERVDAELQALAMHVHYLGCKGQVG